MKINLKQLFSIVGEVRDFSYELAADELGFVKGLEFGAPVKIEGRLYNRAGVEITDSALNILLFLLLTVITMSISRLTVRALK